MNYHIITIFPAIFDSYFSQSIIKRAVEKEKVKINIIDLRDFTSDKHRTVDDSPFGGGAGMVMKIEPLHKAITRIKKDISTSRLRSGGTGSTSRTKTILTSAKGKTWNQKMAEQYSLLDDIIVICGRYEGVDERIAGYIDEEISIGDYVLTGGEIPAMSIVDSTTRLLPGVLGNQKSTEDESHAESGVLEYPQYTRPEIFIDENGKKLKVPEILLSGNHQEIRKWRDNNKKRKSARK